MIFILCPIAATVATIVCLVKKVDSTIAFVVAMVMLAASAMLAGVACSIVELTCPRVDEVETVELRALATGNFVEVAEKSTSLYSSNAVYEVRGVDGDVLALPVAVTGVIYDADDCAYVTYTRHVPARWASIGFLIDDKKAGYTIHLPASGQTGAQLAPQPHWNIPVEAGL